jgi:hypothetical protein
VNPSLHTCFFLAAFRLRGRASLGQPRAVETHHDLRAAQTHELVENFGDGDRSKPPITGAQLIRVRGLLLQLLKVAVQCLAANAEVARNDCFLLACLDTIAKPCGLTQLLVISYCRPTIQNAINDRIGLFS